MTKAIDLNAAPVDDLQTLPGITPELAKAIVAARPYRSLSDVERAGVPRQVLEHISPPATLIIREPNALPSRGQASGQPPRR
jgi:DNA uptake protein ComE-like DNA-binding protein